MSTKLPNYIDPKPLGMNETFFLKQIVMRLTKIRLDYRFVIFKLSSASVSSARHDVRGNQKGFLELDWWSALFGKFSLQNAILRVT